MNSSLYQFVYDTIVERIARGDLVPGQMLPSETSLGEELGVSQGTARKALSELEKSGVVQRRQGKGTFVTSRTEENALFHFFRLRHPDGEQEIPKLVTETVTRRAATKLETQELFGQPREVFSIERLRAISGQNVVYETSVLPTELFPGLEDRAPLPNTIYDLYQRAYNTVVARAQERLKADLPSQAAAEALGIPPDTPILVAMRKSLDLAMRTIELRKSYYVTDKFLYHVELD